MQRWNRLVAAAAHDFRFRLPSTRFHRSIGAWAGVAADPEGCPITDEEMARQLIVGPRAPPAPAKERRGRMRPMTTGEVRFEAGKSALLPARDGQLMGPIVDQAHETRFGVAQAA